MVLTERWRWEECGMWYVQLSNNYNECEDMASMCYAGILREKELGGEVSTVLGSCCCSR